MCMCIYIYMNICVWVCVCVHRWLAKEGILSSAFLTGVRVSRWMTLSILVQRPLCLHELERLEKRKRTKDVGQSGVRLQSRESGFKPKTLVQRSRRAIWSQE